MSSKTLELVFDAMYHGNYDFFDFINCDVVAEYEAIPIKKRIVHKPSKKLKKYHSFLNLFVFEYLKVNNEVVFSYRKGVNAYDAVVRHSNSKHFFQTDIKDFFTSLNVGIVKQVIIDSLKMYPVNDIEKYLNRIIELVTIDGKIPLGFSTSPIISNSCLFEFDNKLLKHCKNNDLIYTRYSDDIIISSSEKNQLRDIESIVQKVLEDSFNSDLKLNTDKSKLTHIGSKIKILGMVILPSGKVTVDIKFKKNVEVLLYFYTAHYDKFLDYFDGDLDKGIMKISGVLNYINTIDSAYLNKLRKKYGSTVVDMFIHRSLR